MVTSFAIFHIKLIVYFVCHPAPQGVTSKFFNLNAVLTNIAAPPPTNPHPLPKEKRFILTSLLFFSFLFDFFNFKFLYHFFYPHTPKDSVSLVCGICFINNYSNKTIFAIFVC